MRYLIVNADDFGYSFNINKGIIEAHTKSIVTSTSVMINAIAASEATELAKYPNLSVGLHFVIKNPNDADNELKAQINKFITIVGRKPAVKSIQKLTPQIKKRLKIKLEFFINQDDPLIYAKALTKPADAQYRFRVGNYRVLFDVEGDKIIVLLVQHRRDVYKK